MFFARPLKSPVSCGAPTNIFSGRAEGRLRASAEQPHVPGRVSSPSQAPLGDVLKWHCLCRMLDRFYNRPLLKILKLEPVGPHLVSRRSIVWNSKCDTCRGMAGKSLSPGIPYHAIVTRAPLTCASSAAFWRVTFS